HESYEDWIVASAETLGLGLNFQPGMNGLARYRRLSAPQSMLSRLGSRASRRELTLRSRRHVMQVFIGFSPASKTSSRLSGGRRDDVRGHDRPPGDMP